MSAPALVERRLDELASRLSAVETALLEVAWDQPAVPPSAGGLDEALEEERLSVPALPLGEGRMSSGASQALFGH